MILVLAILFILQTPIYSEEPKKVIESCPPVAPEYFCPQDYVLTTSDVCFRREVAPKEIECSNGYTRCDEGCCLTVPYLPRLLCPAGTKLIETKNKCLGIRADPLEQVCPKNYSPCGPGICCYKKRVKSIIQCPHGMKFSGDSCIDTTTYEPDWSCPPGYTEETALHTPLLSYLSPSSSTKKLSCIKITSTLPSFDCPEKSYTDNISPSSSCEQVLTTERLAICSLGYQYDEKEAQCVWRAYANPISVECKSPGDCSLSLSSGDKKDLSIVCPTGYTLEKSQCVFKEYLPAAFTCPSGYTLSKSSQCEKIVLHPKTASCPSKDLTPVPASLLPYEKPDPSYSHVCVAVSSVAPMQACLRGGSISKTPQQEKLSLEEKKACKKKQMIPKYDQYDSLCTMGKKERSVCTATVSLAPQVTCPEKATLCPEGCCEQKIQEGKFICPYGSIPEGDRCLVEEISEPVMECPTGFQLRFDKCLEVKVGNMNVVCPLGYQASVTGECEMLLMKEIQVACPEGYYYSTVANKCFCDRSGADLPLIVYHQEEKVEKIKLDNYRRWTSLVEK